MRVLRMLGALSLLGGAAAAEEGALAPMPPMEAVLSQAAADAEPVDFVRQIRPILSDHCFACHGPDEATRKAGLRLDVEAEARAALSGGGHAIVPGDAASSVVLQRIVTNDAGDRMPPSSFNKPLTEAQAALIARWIQQGAGWKGHWAFERVERPALPEVKNPAWTRNAIDHFILARLEEEGLAPSPEAEGRVLARRAALDLTGLPPDPAEARALQADPAGFEAFADRLMQTPQHAEHMARYWLDAARYADTNGYHIDNERFMWRWRDWVIEAFQSNKPFDAFTVEQLAGDLLENATMEQRLASGFNRNHMINFEGGIIDEEYRVQYVNDRVHTTSTVWLGLTMSCAQCHSHKYDPISHEEYYRFYAYFNTIEEKGIDGVEGNSNPLMKAPRAEDAERIAVLSEQLAAVKSQLEAPDPALDEAQAAWERDAHRAFRDRWQPARVASQSSEGGATLELLPDGSTLVRGINPDQDTYVVELETEQPRVTAIRLEALAHDSLPNKAAGRATNGNFVLTEVSVEAAPVGTENWQPVPLAAARADFAQDTFPVEQAIDGDPATGWAVAGFERPEDRVAYFTARNPVTGAKGVRLRVRLAHTSQFGGHGIGRFRLRLSGDSAFTPAAAGEWHLNGPFAAEDGAAAYATAYPPEQGVNLADRYDDGRAKWNRLEGFADGVVHALQGEVAANYLYRSIKAPTARTLQVDLGSNDAIKVWVNGIVVHENEVQRGLEPGKYDRVALPLRAGDNDLLVKVVNYGARHEFYYAGAGEEDSAAAPFDIENALALRPARRSEAQRLALLHYFRERHVPKWQGLRAEHNRLAAELKAAEDAVPTVMVMGEMKEPRETFMLTRGEYDKPAQAVTPGLPAALPPLPAGAPNNRLGLAQWLVHRDNPLTARVTVNRLWQQFFGTGLVKTSEDFGIQGEAPSHPELLDWLAVEFMESGWDLRHIARLIVTSSTYRQDSRVSPALLEHDPANRLLARGPRYRMDAEMIRDNALAISGLLVHKVGGRGVNPYQPPNIWEEVAYGGGFTAQVYQQGRGEDLYRRSMYTFWKRQAPPPAMMVFDAPNREVCAVRRPRTNTPLQALALMNGPTYIEAARFLAQRMLTEPGAEAAFEQRIAHAFQLALARDPSPDELEVLRRLHETQRARFESQPDAALALLKVGEKAADAQLPPGELAAWTALASLILNLDETISIL